MIITKLKGGLGNQMFQYAAGRVLAVTNKQPLLLDVNNYQEDPLMTNKSPRSLSLLKFNLEPNTQIATNKQIIYVKYPLGLISRVYRYLDKKLFRNFYVDAHMKMLKQKEENVYLEGYFQSEKNFLGIREQLLKEFTLKNELLSSEVVSLYQEIEHSNSISIHIRRGDYAEDSSTNKYHGLCSPAYYQRAIDYISKEVSSPIFYIFSDSETWAKENLNFPAGSVFVSDHGFSAEQDLCLMSKCKHNIIANSSFSWWGAWLNSNENKIVIAPKNWLRKGDGPHKNIIPESWIRL